ncbi:MAG: hypothetical protein K0U39_07250 [Alphaproteobacteria bacterium]|nr:hypothetical protein [Alphaproteobacteria bacterium]
MTLFAAHISNHRKRWFMATALLLLTVSFSDLYIRHYFDRYSEQIAIAHIWLYSNDLARDYTPFIKPIRKVEREVLNLVDVDWAKFSIPADGIKDKVGSFTQYRLMEHALAGFVKILGIKELRAIQYLLYFMMTLFSCAVFLYWLLYCFNQHGNYAPLVFTILVWLVVRTDMNIWWNLGRNLLPILLFAFYCKNWLINRCDDSLNVRRYRDYGEMIAVASLLMMFIALCSYDYITIHPFCFLAFYSYYFHERVVKLQIPPKTWLRLWIIGGFLIGIGMVLGVLLAVLIHFQIVPSHKLLDGLTYRSISPIAAIAGEQATYQIPSVTRILEAVSGHILLMLIVPAIIVMRKITGNSKYIALLMLMAPAIGMVMWHVIFPYHSNHISQLRETFSFSALPIILLLFSREDMQFKLPKILTMPKILRARQ